MLLGSPWSTGLGCILLALSGYNVGRATAEWEAAASDYFGVATGILGILAGVLLVARAPRLATSGRVPRPEGSPSPEQEAARA